MLSNFKQAISGGLWGLIFLWCQIPTLTSQNLAELKQFYNYTVSDGLPSMEVYDILQDQKGYIWLGTEAGLSRFDGYQFHTYTTKDGLPNNDVIDIEEDENGRIWINSFGPLAYFERDSFVHYKTNLRNVNSGMNLVKSLLGDYWINYAGEVFIIDSAMQLNYQSEPKSVFGPWNSVHRLFRQGQNIWVANQNTFYKFTGQDLVDSIPLLFPISRFNDFKVIEINDFIYYISDKGLVRMDTKSASREQVVIVPELTSANQLTEIDNDLWLVSLKKGVYQLDVSIPDDVRIKRHFLPHSSPSKVMKDEEGNLWITSYGKGLFFLPINADKFKIIELAGNKLTSNLESVAAIKGKIVVGSLNGRIEILGKDQKIITKVDLSAPGLFNRILEIVDLPSGALLLGTDKGLFKWTSQSTVQIHTFPVKNIYQHYDGQLLINTFRGTFSTNASFLDKQEGNINQEDYDHKNFKRIFAERSYASLIDSENQIWLGNSWIGLTRIRADSVQYLKNLASVFNAVVIDLIELENGLICAATQGDGLILIKGKDYFVINEENGLSGNICMDLLAFEEELWVATNKGITNIRDIDFENKAFNVKVFKEMDGLVSGQINALAIQDSILYMATPNGLMMVDTRDLGLYAFTPRIFIKKLMINGQDVPLQDTFRLEPNQNNIHISYVGLAYRSHGNLWYKYQMEGIDNDWITTTSLETHYSNLPPGNYIFKVTALGTEGQLSTTVDEVRFVIKAPFYQTIGFQIFLILLSIGLLYIVYSFIYNYQQRSDLKRLVTAKTKALNQKYQDLEEVNIKLERSNRELQQFAHVASHDLKAPLRNVAGFVQLLHKKAKHKLNREEKEFIDFAVAGVKRMNLIIEDLLSMSKIDRLEQDKEAVPFAEVVADVINDLQFQIEEKTASVLINGNFPILYFNRTNAKQLIQNLITNALTYQDKAKPTVEIFCNAENGHWLFGIKDNGIGIPLQYKHKVFEIFQRLHAQNEYVGTGIGLAICKKIVEKNNGKIWYQSKEGEGTTFFFTLPDSIAI